MDFDVSDVIRFRIFFSFFFLNFVQAHVCIKIDNQMLRILILFNHTNF